MTKAARLHGSAFASLVRQQRNSDWPDVPPSGNKVCTRCHGTGFTTEDGRAFCTRGRVIRGVCVEPIAPAQLQRRAG